MFGVILERQKKKPRKGYAQNQSNYKGPYQILQEMRTRRKFQVIRNGLLLQRGSGVLDTRSGTGVIRIRRNAGRIGVPIHNCEDAKAESAENDEQKEDEKGEVLEGSRPVIVGDLEELGLVRFGGFRLGF